MQKSHVQTQELSIYDFMKYVYMTGDSKEHMNKTQRLGKSLEY